MVSRDFFRVGDVDDVLQAEEYDALVVCSIDAKFRTASGGGRTAAAAHCGHGRLAEVARVLRMTCRNMVLLRIRECRSERWTVQSKGTGWCYQGNSKS